MIDFTPFQKSDSLKMQGFRPYSAFGITGRVDGQIVAYGGIHHYSDGRHWGFLSVFDERYRSPVLLHRIAVGILNTAKSVGISVYVMCDTAAHPRAEAWLRRLGFRDLEPSEWDEGIGMLERRGSGKNRAFVK